MKTWRNRSETRHIVVATSQARAWELLGINRDSQWDDLWEPMRQPRDISREGVYFADGHGGYELIEEDQSDPNIRKVLEILYYVMYACEQAGMSFERAEAIHTDICWHLENFGEDSPKVAQMLVEMFQQRLAVETENEDAA